ncbi:arginine--tRNA ligase [Candidatus Uhrbacteria bacterium]|nr:arginine--tRNA ligase [Candidatus Uhrbacteria bacterium]
MSAWNGWKQDIAKKLSDQLGVQVAPGEMVIPPDTKMGDFAFGCFRLAKEQKKSPTDLAQIIAQEFKTQGTDIVVVSAVGPYVNFQLAIGNVVSRVIQDVEKMGEGYGASPLGAGNQILIEYANPNTHKEMHIGHLRNFVVGFSIVQLIKMVGYKATPISYINDVGANVAKCLWFLVKKYNFDPRIFSEQDYQKLLSDVPQEIRTANHLGMIYTEATVYTDTHPEAKEEISFVQNQLEAHVSVWEQLWHETRQWSLDEFYAAFRDLGVKIERQFFESEVIDRSQTIVDGLLKQGIAKESQGALIIDLEEKKLGVALLRKSDGNLLYFPKDLALAELKMKEYPSFKSGFIITDVRQSFYFKQLFEVLKRMGIKQAFQFVGYEIVTLKEGVMSSRKGNIVTYESFRDAVIEYARKEIVERHADWSKKKVDDIAWNLAMAGIKFGMLKQDNDKVYTFDLEQALSFDGATGPYCQYAATRLGSIFKKAKRSLEIPRQVRNDIAFDHESEKRLALKLAAFPSIVEQAAKELRPSIVAQWCFECSQSINEFYRDVPVLESTGDLLEGRLRLVGAARQTLIKGLDLLGISVPEEM